MASDNPKPREVATAEQAVVQERLADTTTPWKKQVEELKKQVQDLQQKLASSNRAKQNAEERLRAANMEIERLQQKLASIHPPVAADHEPNQGATNNSDISVGLNTCNTEDKDLDTLGVSVFHLEHDFLGRGSQVARSSKIYDIENLKGPPGIIRKKGAGVVCPLDGHMGAAYVHCLEGEDHFGEATHMLSYSWDYSIGDIVDTLSDFCLKNQLDPKRTYIWICCLCVNQHRVVKNAALQNSGMTIPSHVDFFAIFGEKVKKIGHLLAMMAPWSAPVYLTRVWCIFEIFTAHTTDGCQVDIVMPPTEKLSLEQDVIDNGSSINALYETLGKTHVENAKASVESDRLAILSQIESGAGYQGLNNEVNSLLRGWMLGVITELAETRENTYDEDYAIFCNQAGIVLQKNGEPDAAMHLFQSALAVCEDMLGENSFGTATTYNNIGAVLEVKGDYNDALLQYSKALTIQEKVLGKYHPAVATTYSNIGLVLQRMGDFNSALSKYEECLAIGVSTLGRHHTDVATTYNNIGSILWEIGDYEGALLKHKEALAARLSALGKNHPDTAQSFHNIGSTLVKQGNYDEALLKFEECLAIWEPVLGRDHPNTKECMKLKQIAAGKARREWSQVTMEHEQSNWLEEWQAQEDPELIAALEASLLSPE
ncbi:Kinesin light chain [Seminavis robusta]|uniref:Kinesin light chain n=1 Tax=Seminavis robusta TaxID=568900 RepID=A0A9N8DNS4_9STRA|nr:Kinesin light chain [Seminavis robusta]|eukprot:Sro250_g099090.1 Kinesin light chain (656) ;mRNA; f:77308-79275